MLSLLLSCNYNNGKIAKIEANKIQNFGKIKVGDTITKVYSFKNSSDNILKISHVKTSCGCTVAKLSDSIINLKSKGFIKVKFIAEKDNIGSVEKSIIIEANTDPIFTVLYLKGEVVK
jgi:hypothetical protein